MLKLVLIQYKILGIRSVRNAHHLEAKIISTPSLTTHPVITVKLREL